MDTNHVRKAQVADELRKSIKCRHLARQFVARLPQKLDPDRSYIYPFLRELLVPEYPGLSDSVVGELMKKRLEAVILIFTASFRFRRSSSIVEYEAFQAVCLLLWSFTEDAPADTRRYMAMEVLGDEWDEVDVGTWRRAHGPEWEVCLGLAGHLMEWAEAKESGDDEIAA